MLDWSLMTRTLAAEAPWWSPGTAHGYHVNTFGFLVGELVRRVTGRPPATALRDEVAGPLGADVHLGLRRHEHHRVAEVPWPGEPPAEEDPPDLVGIELMIHNAYFNPSGLSGAGVVNTPAWREAVIPSTNLHASARGVALVYQALVAVLSRGGTGLVDRSALAEAVTEQVSGVDLVLGRSSRFGLGFQLTQPDRPLGPGPAAFGHFGAGGSLGFCDPDAGVAFGYVMNHLGPRWQNPRNRALIDAVFESLV
jgi:CubicO group peptidase (beta-lactamase class C family)